MTRYRRSRLLVLIGLVVLGGTVVAGTVTAPSWETVADGDRSLVVGSQSTGGGYESGGAVFRMDGSTVTWETSGTDGYFDVAPLDDGSVVAAVEESGYEEGCGPYESPCVKTGFRVIDPDADGGPRVVSEYLFPVRRPSDTEVHAVDPIGDDAYVVADMDAERVFTLRDGEVTWQWNASSFYEPPADPTSRDWLHVNDVDAINETHFLVSVRNANQLLVLERGAGVVEVVNADDGDASEQSCQGKLVDADDDGDVRCGDPDVLHRQHNPQWLGDGAVLVADSENDRAVELHRDDETGDWEPVWAVTGAHGAEFDWPRDADRLPNGNTLVTDTYNGRVVEVAPNGSVVRSVDTFHLPYEADALPHGELAGAQRYEPNDTVPDTPDDVRVLRTAAFAVRGQFAFVPAWFEEPHLLAAAAGLLLLIGGLAAEAYVRIR